MFDIPPQTLQLAGTWLARILGAVLGLLIANIVAGMLRDTVRRQLDRAKIDETLARFFANLTRYVVLTLSVLAVLGIFGIETTSFAAVLGGATLAVGMALKGTLGNFAAGVMLLVFRPFKVGDVIKTSGQQGKVDEINLFSTTLDTPDNCRIIVPNGGIFSGTIENISFHGERRVEVLVGIDYAADIDETRAVLEAAAASVPDQPEGRAPAVFLSALGGSSVDWAVRVWCKSADFAACHQATVRAVKNAVDDAGIGIPFPTMDVNLRQMPPPSAPKAS